MINNNNKTTFLITSIITVMLIGISVSSIQPAYAHVDRPNCTAFGGELELVLYRDADNNGSFETPFNGPVVQGEFIDIRTQIISNPSDTRCAIDGGLFGPEGMEENGQILISHPDDAKVSDTPQDLVLDGYGCLGGSFTTDDNIGASDDCSLAVENTDPVFASDEGFLYQVSCEDIQEEGDPFFDDFPGRLVWFAEADGVYHNDNLDNVGEVNGFFDSNDANQECIIPKWEADTESDPNGTIDAPVDMPSDAVNISTTDGVQGDSFTATWELVDELGNTQSGDCDAPGLLDANGETTITCTADGPADFGQVGVQTCWTVEITAPNGYVAAAGQDNPLVGTFADTPLECFIVENPEGLTPGFWKANAENWDAGAWWLESPEDDFNDVFGTDVELRLAKGNAETPKGTSSDPTLYGALGARGGGDDALARHCVAAKLNAENPDVNYPWDKDTVIGICGAVLNGGNPDGWTVDTLKDQLDAWNNSGADISQHWTEPQNP